MAGYGRESEAETLREEGGGAQLGVKQGEKVGGEDQRVTSEGTTKQPDRTYRPTFLCWVRPLSTGRNLLWK